MRRPIRAATSHSTAMFVSLLMFVPIYLVGVNSLKTDPKARSMGPGLPTELRFDNFGIVIEDGKLGRAFVNSMIYTGGPRCSASSSRQARRSSSRETPRGSTGTSTFSWLSGSPCRSTT